MKDTTTWAPDVNIDLKTYKEDNPKLLPFDRASQEQISEFFIKIIVEELVLIYL